jgi:hypothetical protein
MNKQQQPIGQHDLSTSAGGRAFLAEFFATHLRRHDFQRYIEERLAADFACALAGYLSENVAAIAAGGAQAPAELRAIHDLLHTQDNRITAAPMFAVQEKKRVYGIDESYGPKIVWVTDDGDEVDAEKDAELEAVYQQDYNKEPRGYRRLGYHEYWDFVTACFTEQGCKDYLGRNGHNLHETRIYAYGTYRNAEWHTVRDFLMSDRFAAAPAASNGEQA